MSGESDHLPRVLDAHYIDLTIDAPPLALNRAERIAWAAPSAADEWGSDTRAGFDALFDGGGIEHWRVAGAGRFAVVGDRLESVPGDDVGLFWCTRPAPPDFVLRLEWLRWRHEDSSGVIVRCPRPSAGPRGTPVAAAIQRGFEVRLDEVGGAGMDATHRTGAIVGQRHQRLRRPIVRPPAEWNALEITVRGQHYAVRVNGELANELDNRDRARGRSSTPQAPSFIGLRLFSGSRVAFRRIGIRAL